MARKNRTMIIALGVLALLGAIYYGTIIQGRNRAAALVQELPPPAPTLGNLDSSEVVKIEVSGMVLEKHNEMWELVSLDGEAPPQGVALDQGMLRNLVFVLATVWAERIAEENPDDLSVFGLESPASRTIVTDSRGNTAVYLVGDQTPFRNSYFVMAEGNPDVFVVSAFSADRLRFTLDDIRNRFLFPPQLPLQALTRMRIESPGAVIDMSLMPEPRPLHLISTFSRFMMTSPFNLPRGVDSEALEALLTPFNNRRIGEFVNDFPLSLAPYGLDTPAARFRLEFGVAYIELLIGNRSGTDRYAKLAGAPGVFTVSGLDPIVNITPFTLVDRFALLMGINEVSHLSVSGGERPLNADFQGEGPDMIFHLNGRRTEERSSRNWFQSVIALRVDAEIPAGGDFNPASPEHITVEYHLRNGERASFTLIPFNRDFYVLSQEGTMEFLIARNQVRRIFQTADMVLDEG